MGETTRRVVATALAVAAMLVATGSAIAATPNLRYAGGAVLPLPQTRLVGLRISPMGDRVSLLGAVQARCSNGTIVDSEDATLRAIPLDVVNVFRGFSYRRVRVSAREVQTRRLYVTGQVFDERRAAGTIRYLVYRYVSGRAPVRCDEGIQHWEARAVGVAPSGAPATRPGLSFYGPTSGTSYIPFGVGLHVSADGTRVDRTFFGGAIRCTGLGVSGFEDVGPSRTIRPDGSFLSVQPVSTTEGGVAISGRQVLAGQFAGDGAVGTLRLSAVFRRRGRVIGSCDTGTLTWAAVP